MKIPFSGDFPESERAAEQVLSLPLFPQIKPEEQERVVALLVGAGSRRQG